MQREQIADALPEKFKCIFYEWLDDWTATHIQIARHADFDRRQKPQEDLEIPF